MNLSQRSRLELIRGPEFLLEVFVTVSERGDGVLGGEIHKGCEGRLAQFCSTTQRDPVFTVKFECQKASGLLGEVGPLRVCGPQKCRRQLYILGFHVSKLTHPVCFVIGFPDDFRKALILGPSTVFDPQEIKRSPREKNSKKWLCVALDASYTHMYGPGTRRHIKNALKAGATIGEIMEVLKLCVVQGVQACTLGVSILAEELERNTASQNARA
jgi:hypothetical protein